MGKLFFFFMLIITLIYALLNPASVNTIVIETLTLWFFIVLPSILPMYLIAHFLMRIPLFTKIFYPLLKPLFHFENETACAIYLVSILSGNPTSTSLIITANQNKLISLSEANRLLKFCPFISPLFIMAFSNKLHPNLAPLFLGSQVLASFIIANSLPQKNKYHSLNDQSLSIETISNILSKAPFVLLNIGVTMVMVNIIKQPLLLLINLLNPKTFILPYVLSLLEISTGLNDLLKSNLPLTTSILLFSSLLSLSGLAIHLQVITNIGRSQVSYKSFLLYRICHMLIALIIITLLIYHLWEILLLLLALIIIINIYKQKKKFPRERSHTLLINRDETFS